MGIFQSCWQVLWTVLLGTSSQHPSRDHPADKISQARPDARFLLLLGSDPLPGISLDQAVEYKAEQRSSISPWPCHHHGELFHCLQLPPGSLRECTMETFYSQAPPTLQEAEPSRLDSVLGTVGLDSPTGRILPLTLKWPPVLLSIRVLDPRIPDTGMLLGGHSAPCSEFDQLARKKLYTAKDEVHATGLDAWLTLMLIFCVFLWMNKDQKSSLWCTFVKVLLWWMEKQRVILFLLPGGLVLAQACWGNLGPTSSHPHSYWLLVTAPLKESHSHTKP